ncbi:SUN domain-containing protein 1 isoform X2 [Nerophis ophidion]|uniref:SUN domain-containing protein 1 isoform X2 n=1 Tax=Nerophis ophidion TaxID=159077 RepID=UPI002ADFB1A4|nr:SUN domain-containing protein 1 isoform X2 [Nerophis ophidion]
MSQRCVMHVNLIFTTFSVSTSMLPFGIPQFGVLLLVRLHIFQIFTSSSYSTAALEFEKEHQIAPVYESPRMSRRSLRLQTSGSHHGNDSQGDFTQNQRNSSYTTKRESRTLRSRKLQAISNSMSLSLSQAATPRTTHSFLAVSTPINSSSRSIEEHNTVSDASLHTTEMDQMHLRQRTITKTTTTVDGNWGMTSHSEQSGASVNGDISASNSHTRLANGYVCKDCSFHSQQMDSHTTHSSLSTSHAADVSKADAFSYSSSSPFTNIYSRDRSRKSKTGVLTSVSNTCVRLSKKVLAPFVSFFTLLYSSVCWLSARANMAKERGLFASCKDSMRRTMSSSWSQVWLLKQNTLDRLIGNKSEDSQAKDSMRRTMSSSLSQVWLLKQNTLGRLIGNKSEDSQAQAHSSFCGSMNVNDLANEDASHLNLNGSLCDDCKGKQFSETQTVLLTQSSRSQRLVGALWSLLAYTGHCLLQPGYFVARGAKALSSSVGTMTQRILTLLWTAVTAPVKAGRSLLWILATGWYQLVSLMCLLNVFFLTRCLPKLWKLLLLLLPLLLLFALWLWGPSAAALFACLPAVKITEWRPSSPITFLSNLVPAAAPILAPRPESPLAQTPATTVSQAPPIVVPSMDLERLERLERQLALLWERVQQSEEKQEQHHMDTLSLYNSLKETLHTETDRERLGLWVSSLLEQRLGVLRGELKQDSILREQSEEQLKVLQESQTTRLADLELLLSALAVKTEGVQQKQRQYELEKEDTKKEFVAAVEDTPPLSVGVQQEDHDALLAEVQRLELDLGRIRQDLQGVMGCKGKCEQLDTLQETISAQVSSQVRKELQALFYGSGSSGEGQGEVPESLVLWLSQRYVSTPDLQAWLASLEQRIMRNVSMQLELNRAQTLVETESKASLAHTVTDSVHIAAAAEGLTEEHVKLIVQNALKLYSQDRTGLVDYALESGGGSILSTRCSETYETKTALMSLFGLPLWYFSQSPRVVIQPDMYPGNCWAFKGSQGYLVIRLSLRIKPTSFCLEHIPKALSPTGNITSAPQNFTVFGLDDEYQEEGDLLGHYTYQEDGESMQIFPIQEPTDKAFQIIEVRVLSNWGHPDYTCLYRFRVHGEPRPQ